LTALGAISILEEPDSYFTAEIIAQGAFTTQERNTLFVSISLHQTMGSIMARIDVTVQFSRNINGPDTKNVSKGAAIALILN
jgi:hypothetical protein